MIRVEGKPSTITRNEEEEGTEVLRNQEEEQTKPATTEARWHIGMSSASHREDPGSNPGKGENY